MVTVPSMVKFLAGFLMAICVALLAGYVFVVEGGMPVATSGAALPLERWVARASIHAAVSGEADKQSPVALTESALMEGAKDYINDCAGCHGLPGHPKTGFAKALFPHPPQLFESDEGVTDHPVGVIHWKVKNGIRLTGMPAFADLLNKTQIWQISLLLKNADSLSNPVRQKLNQAGK